MIELIHRAAAHRPDTEAVVYGDKVLSYGELLAAAEQAAAWLRQQSLTRVALLDPDPTVILPLLAGASLAGVEACVYPPTANAEMIADFQQRFSHATVLPSREPASSRHSRALLESLPPQRPHLVLTTGTTGAPRAVRHDWSRLLNGLTGAPLAPAQRWMLSYGMNQFGGLQVVLHTLSIGATLVVAESFQPRVGLLGMREHDVTHASATPTFWRFLLAELRSEGGPPPALQQITLGGEAPSEQVLADLARTFPAARITQIYAANEFGRARSVRDAVNGLPLESLGKADERGVELKVTDGELWVRSGSGMLGYYGEDPIDPEEWRPTGDLVEVVGDRVLFRGRTSEVINVGGIKVHPLPVEERVNAVPGVAMSRVFGRKNALTGAVVAVEVVAAAGADTDVIDAAIREACADLPPASRPRSIRFVDEIATTGHKIIRRDVPGTTPTREPSNG